MEKTLKALIQRVNSTLKYYEKEYIEVQRTPELEREKCMSFKQFVEIRFNMECCRVPELAGLEKILEGRLFSCTEMEGGDEVKRRFTTATVELVSPEMLENPPQSLIDELEQVKNALGGRKIKFNSVKQKIKFEINE